MNKLEVAKLYKEIKKRYANFDASLQAVEEDLGMLHDIPYDVAYSNVRQHIMTSDFPPKISQIRGRLGEQIERERMKEATTQHFQNLDAWSTASKPPPAGYWDDVRRKIRGEANA
ncbi:MULTISPECIES: hypothetical protein [Paenibacillus]|uniref:Replicative helicase inhibitor G39P N-terminal domain-containing protein n=1 Tax=Paenibacillus agri TaxID=2744309 RepID=A0A850EQA1_9BACL|nr:hypothetical protein [Paenibacillus agri]NUU62666.1 hypothetical protein [Paenibacillus agri]